MLTPDTHGSKALDVEHLCCPLPGEGEWIRAERCGVIDLEGPPHQPESGILRFLHRTWQHSGRQLRMRSRSCLRSIRSTGIFTGLEFIRRGRGRGLDERWWEKDGS